MICSIPDSKFLTTIRDIAVTSSFNFSNEELELICKIKDEILIESYKGRFTLKRPPIPPKIFSYFRDILGLKLYGNKDSKELKISWATQEQNERWKKLFSR